MLAKQVVLITGTSTGFGRLIAVALAKKDYTVFASMRDTGGRNRPRATDLEELAKREKWRLSVVELDVNHDSSVRSAIDRVVREAGHIDVVINNAGFGSWGLVEAFTVDQAKEIFETNFFGPLRVNRAVLPHMRRRRNGLLIHVSSGAGRLVIPSMGLYCATKFALEAMAETLRYEVSQLGIDAVIIEPGAYPTEIFVKALAARDQPTIADYGAVAAVPGKVHEALASSRTDPQEVVNRVIEVIEMPAGLRPVRSLVGKFVEQFQPLNDAALQSQTTALQAFGLSDLMTVRGDETQSTSSDSAPARSFGATAE
jgi:NAD(P)-dependent dehydrogenase (short-subunit alcohol dehydrogenase family)